MKLGETISALPIEVEKSIRGEEIRALTSARAGKIVPVAYVPLLREDRVSRGSVNLRLKMAETVHPLMNAINVTAMAHFVPFSAFERFDGMDQFNRSYRGVNEPRGAATPIPFFTTMAFSSAAEIWKTLGVHWPAGSNINAAPIEAYNTLVNFRRKARSEKLALRTLSDTTLAAAFWKNPNLYHIVPDFDQAMQDGQVQLAFADASLPLNVSSLPVRNLYYRSATTGDLAVAEAAAYTGGSAKPGSGNLKPVYSTTSVPSVDLSNVWTEMTSAGAAISLANIDLAKKTAAFAKLREQYAGMDDDHLIDLLMQGIRVPDEALRQPILLDRQSTIFGYSERHATDGANLDQSVTTGETAVSLNFRTPPMNTGGIILITVEIVPEQLFERMQDVFLAADAPADLPDFTRDFLDPEKVEVVPNAFVDVLHGTPAGTFGYAPLNHRWKRSLTRIGGRYYRPTTAGFVEDRQRFWSVEQLNPALTTDFYLVPASLPHTVFADSAADPFEILTLGGVEIIGNTVFGAVLDEDRGDYEAVAAKVDETRIQQV